MLITLGRLRTLVREAAEFPSWDELSKREQLLSTYSDVYKEKYGIRPRGQMERMQGWTDEEIEAELNSLQDTPGPYDYEDSYEYEPSDPGYYLPSPAEVTPEELDTVHPMEDMPTKIPMKGGEEMDALSAKSKKLHHWRAGRRRAAKHTYNKRLRRV